MNEEAIYELDELLNGFEDDFDYELVNDDEYEENNINYCSICGTELWSNYHGYEYLGNNAYPVNDGRCCDDCNSKYVIPARLRQMYASVKEN